MKEKFDKKLTDKILPKFNNAKEWSDLTTILKNLKENLEKYKTFNMTNMSDKVLLAKRLAQSLNPSLPGGLHEITLEVYDMIFENIKSKNDNNLGPDLGLYSSGLFPFFQFATVPNKTLYLNRIIKKHYLEISDQEFTLCLPGFLVSILPGLDDTNEALLKSIKDIFLISRKKVGESCFFGVLWSIILRTQRMRLVGMKYISEAIPPYKTVEENLDTKDEFVANFYPNLPVLVINALCAVIEDEVVLVQRLAMDFVISRFPLYNKILIEEDKISLIISGLNLLIKNDYSTTRRLHSWLIGGNQDDEIEMGDPNIQYMIELLISSLKKIFDKKNATKEKLSSGMKIIDQLFKQKVKLVDYVMENVSIDLISCVEEYWQTYTGGISNSQSENDEIIIKVKKFFEYDPSYLDCLWNSLGRKLNSAINNNQADFTYEVNNSIKLLKLCLYYIKLEAVDRKIKFYIPIISSLLKVLLMFNIDSSERFGEIKSILFLALKFTKSLQDAGDDLGIPEGKTSMSATGIIPNNNQSRFSFKKRSSLKYILKQNSQNVSLIESFMENILLYQSFYINICRIIYKQAACHKKDVNRADMKVFKQATELTLRIQEYATQDRIPEWVSHLEKIVFSQNIELSLEGIFYLLDLFMIISDNEVYSNIKYYLRNEELDTEIIDDQSTKNIIQQTHVLRNCCEMAMAKLWVLLEEQNFQKPVIDLLIKYYRAEPIVFSNTISNTFSINDLDQNVNAIKKFSQFWKLTSEFYPDIIFFENGECIFKMLDFLDDEHPLLRHLSKSWLSQSVGQFNKILDPLLKVLLDRETCWYISFKKQLFFAKEYDNRRIIEAFRKLKNIIINMTDLAIKYFLKNPVSQFLLDMDDIGKELSSVSRTIPMEHYLELMVSISLRFIQGKFIESISRAFYRENFSVNAASCEFLEFLLSFIDPKSKVMSIAEMIAEPVLQILHESIISNDEVMQVQLLSLLKVLLFSTKEVHKDFKQQAVNIFNSPLLHECINLGIQINYIFVRGHFIYFVECCLPIFREILDQASNLKIAKKLIDTTSEFLVKRVKYFEPSSHISNSIIIDGISISSKNLSQMEPISKSKFFILKNYLDEYKEFKSLDENDVNVIIKGLRQILFHFINIDVLLGENDVINWGEFKKILNSKNSSTSFREYLGGLFSSKNFNDNVAIQSNSQIGIEIFGTLENVLASFLCCWVNDSEEYMSKDLCLNENGILSYNYEENRFQTIINEESAVGNKNLNITSSDGKSVRPGKSTKQLKSQIIAIAYNLFLSNPIEFMNKFISLWTNERNIHIEKDKQYKLSMIELLVSLNVPADIIINAITKNINPAKIKEYKRSKVKFKDMYPYLQTKEQCTFEAKICHLVYSYMIFNRQLKVDKSIIDIWNEMITFFTIFMESKAASTFLWVYEILNIILYKLPIRETSTDYSIKKKLTSIITNLFTKTMDLSINNKYDAMFDEPSAIILPMNPSIYEKVALEFHDKEICKINSVLHERYTYSQLERTSTKMMMGSGSGSGNVFMTTSNVALTTCEENVSDSSIRNFYKQLYDYVTNGSVLKNEELFVAYRNIGFITLKSLFYSTMKNIYLPDRNDKMVVHIQVLMKNLILIMSERIGFNQIYVDMATEFVHSLMINASMLTSNSCKTMIMDFFLDAEFFNMTKKCLRLWKEIIREFSHYYQEIIVDLLNTLNSSSFWSKGADKFKIKAMRRVSFIIYSCIKDTYSNKLGLILEKVKDVITTYSENPPLEVEIFLMIRIMFLRFSHENLIEMLRHLWPIIFSELVNVISQKKKANSLDLDLSCFKLIELLSLANIEEFCLYQWIFLLDTYDVSRLNPENPMNIINALVLSDKKTFKPFSMDLVKDFNKYQDLVADFNIKKHDDYEKRGLIIQLQKLTDKDELANLVARVFFYIGLMNNFRSKIDWEAIEDVIENDFLTPTY